MPPTDTTIKSFGYVRIDGSLARGDVPRLADALIEAERGTKGRTQGGDRAIYVIVSSPGGEVLAAIDMGRLLRNAAARTWIDRDSDCSSACVLLLAGAVVRYDMSGSRVGLHRPVFPNTEFAGLTYTEAQRHYNSLLNTVRAYLQEMGVNDSIYQTMQAVPSQTIHYIPREQAEAAQLFGEDPAYSEWQRARAIEGVGESRVQMLDRFKECYNDRLREGREGSCSSMLENWRRQEP